MADSYAYGEDPYDINILYATPDYAIVDFSKMNEAMNETIHSYLRHPTLDSTAPRTLKEFVNRLPKTLNLEQFRYEDWRFWTEFLQFLSETNPTIPRIEFHFSYTYGPSVSTVFTCATDGDGNVWFNKYLNATVVARFYSKNRRLFRKPIDPNTDLERVFNIKKYKDNQPTTLFDEMRTMNDILTEYESRIMMGVLLDRVQVF
jgi:hypothetical protein